MQPALHITTTVLPDNRIEIDLPPGTAGQQVTVFVVLTEQSSNPDHSVLKSASALAQMAADPEIQAELKAIDTEFKVTEMDGLQEETSYGH